MNYTKYFLILTYIGTCIPLQIIKSYVREIVFDEIYKYKLKI